MAYHAALQRVVYVDGDTWLYGNLSVPSVQPMGAPCGSGGGPGLFAPPPFLGHAGFGIELHSALGSAPWLLGLDLRAQALALGPCVLRLVAPPVLLAAATSASGFGSVRLSLPVDPGLRGNVYFAQAFVPDPVGGFAGLAFSPALRITVGD